VLLPPWLVGLVSTARSRAGDHAGSQPSGLMPLTWAWSRAGARGRDVARSHAEGRAADPTAVSKAGSSSDSSPCTHRPPISSAWIYQDDKQIKKHGAEADSWYVGWYEPDGTKRGKSCGPGEQGRRNAQKLRRKLEAQLMTGTYQMHTTKL
jgi:hypothetical protein